MLSINLSIDDLFDEQTGGFHSIHRTIQMEHSLKAVSKWESIWETSFLQRKDKTSEQLFSYLQCMCLHEEDEEYVRYFRKEHVEEISKYMERKMTAAWFPDTNKGTNQYITAEDFYYQMLGNGIPLECENWHLKRLLALIRTFQERNEPPKKRTNKEIMTEYRELNRKRREKWNSKG